MKSLFRIEFNRILHNKLFWATMIIGCAITVSQYVMYVRPCLVWLADFELLPFAGVCPHTWYEKWIGGEWLTFQSYLYFLILPILAAIPCGLTMAKDKASGYQLQLFSRIGKCKYYLAKYVVGFVSGGVAVLIPLIVNLWLSVITLPSIIPDPATGTSAMAGTKMLGVFYFAHPNLYILLWFGFIFLFSGLFAVFALVIGEATKSGFLSAIFPFLFYVFIYVICTVAQIGQCAPFNFLTPAQRADFVTPVIIGTEFFGLLVFLTTLYAVGAKRNQTIG